MRRNNKGQFVKGNIGYWKGKKRIGQSIGLWMKNKKMPKKTKIKINKSLKGKIPKNVGKGKYSPSWKGGVSTNPEKIKQYKIGYWQKRQEKLANRKKPNQCEICGAFGKICFDHNHKTGKFRGWVCQRCNLVLGFVKDNTELLNMLIEYLKK